jgi:NAD(P)-dependent dehydrogenase (short-subunit alcohol dehydrogenase family)
MDPKRTLFITGAAAGIGRETARLFHSRGFGVGLYDIDRSGVEALAGELGARALTGTLDVTDAAAFAEACSDFQSHFGRFDVLLNNAGVLRMGRFDDVPLEMHRRTIDVNVNGVINGIAAALPHLRATARQHGKAHVINMCSASAIYGTPDHSTYSASKFAVRALTEALSLEFSSYGIVVSDVLPGYVDTGMVRDQAQPSAILDKIGVAHAPDQIAELIWKAASGDKVHRFGNIGLAFTDRFARMLPGITRRVMDRLR